MDSESHDQILFAFHFVVHCVFMGLWQNVVFMAARFQDTNCYRGLNKILSENLQLAY
jgi:hypothetical protein